MKQKIKLKLDDLKVKSFVTAVDKTETIKGGADLGTINVTMCTRLSCGIVACTQDVLNCF